MLTPQSIRLAPIFSTPSTRSSSRTGIYAFLNLNQQSRLCTARALAYSLSKLNFEPDLNWLKCSIVLCLFYLSSDIALYPTVSDCDGQAIDKSKWHTEPLKRSLYALLHWSSVCHLFWQPLAIPSRSFKAELTGEECLEDLQRSTRSSVLDDFGPPRHIRRLPQTQLQPPQSLLPVKHCRKGKC